MASNTTRTSVVLFDTKRLVENFQRTKGLRNFSETLRYIINDYFKIINKLDEARTADFNRVCDLISGSNRDFGTDLTELKQSINEVRNMLVLIAHNDDDLQELFIQYFPKYFNT
jgi:hypothetical protein